MQRWSQHVHVEYWFSPDRGQHWQQRADLPSAADAELNALAWVQSGSTLYALQGSSGLLATPWQGRDWGTPVVLAPARTAKWDRPNPVSAICASGQGPHAVLTWIDGRHQKSDRRWWKPLGGWPWSDQPDWRNNDIYVLTGTALSQALQGQAKDAHRLTDGHGAASSLACASAANSATVYWSGTTQWRKNGQSDGMQIFAAPPPANALKRQQCFRQR